MKLKSKFWKFALGGLGVATTVSTVGVALVSCSGTTKVPKFYTADSSHGELFKPVTGGTMASPSISFMDYMKSLLMNPDVSSKFFDGVANLVVLTWFKNVAEVAPNSKIADTYNEWKTEIGLDPFTGADVPSAKGKGSAQEQLKEYEKKYGKDSNVVLQNEVYNKAGGSKQAWIQSKYLEKVKDEFVKNVFSNEHMLLSAIDGNTTFALNSNFKNKVDEPKFVNSNGAATYTSGAGQKNNFKFTAATTKLDSNSVDYQLAQGYADFLDFALDQYIATEMPLMSNMSLFKPTAPVTNDTSDFFNINYFGKDTIGTDGSYKFQVYKSGTGDQTGDIDVVGKWSRAIDQLNNQNTASYAVNASTGAINLSKLYTDDSSTYMVNDATKIFADTVTPFAAAVTYKFGTLWATQPTTGNYIDTQVQNLQVNNIDKSNIMNNFLVFKSNSPAAQTAKWINTASPSRSSTHNLNESNFLKFEYDTQSAFNGTSYEGAVGILDTFNVLDSSQQQTPFIITRNEFGVHIVGIDRYFALKEASKVGQTNFEKIQSVRNEIRNTVLYRYAKYLVNGNDTTNGFDLKTKLETYVKDNFASLIISYTKNTTSSNQNHNLFSNLTIGSKQLPAIELANNLVDASLAFNDFKNAMNIKTAMETIKSKMYKLQETYLNNQKPEEWKNNGLAGVLPYKRNGKTGSFDYLENVQWMTMKKGLPSGVSVKTIDEAIYKLSDIYETKIDLLLKNFGTNGGLIIVDKNNPNKSSQIFATTTSVLSSELDKGTLNLLNNVIGNVSSTDFSNPIILNRYIKYLIGKKILSENLGVQSVPDGNIFGTAISENAELQTAINNLYFLNNFTSQSELFDNGDITDNASISTIAKTIFSKTFYNSIGFFNNSSVPQNKVFYLKNTTQSYDLFKFLLAIENLTTKNNEEFLKYLQNQISYGEQAYITWVRSDSITANITFGNNQDNPSADFSTFKKDAAYLTKLNGYAYMNAPFIVNRNGEPTTLTSSTITYTTDLKYFSVANFGNSSSSNTPYNGFYGLQTSESNNLPSVLTDGTSNETNVFSNNVWKNNNDGSTYKFQGSMYKYNTLDEYISKKLYEPANPSTGTSGTYKINTISEFQSFINDFATYEFDLAANDPNFSDSVDKYLNETIMNEASNNLNNAIANFVQYLTYGSGIDQSKLPKVTTTIDFPIPSGHQSGWKTIPETAFQQYSGPLFTTNVTGKNKSPVFTSGTSKVGTEIMVEQINRSTIDTILNTSGTNSTPWTTLNITKSAYYSLLVNAAMDPEVQSKAVELMNKAYSKIDVYDVRLNDGLPIVIISNYVNPNKDEDTK